MSKFRPLNSEDVVQLENPFLLGHKTFTIKEFISQIRDSLRVCDRNQANFAWLEEGVACEILPASGNTDGWKNGKIRIHIEFCEDESEPIINPGQVISEKVSLNSLRSES